ncbi:MAG: hypothetical protein A2328_08340 [Bdellovibrionales bacterium RIFOXYB2_FULL_36_6]|nr:MAG: hypothetical protein A2328_08340 [Bdellovibrionales bacterium RIFOXYB2_FULL_36_6]
MYGTTRLEKDNPNDSQVFIENPYAYTGRIWEQETGLYDYRARYYSPETGRFLSEDPIGFGSGDMNFYRYAHSAPLNYIDPYGYSFASFMCNFSFAFNNGVKSGYYLGAAGTRFVIGGGITLVQIGTGYGRDAGAGASNYAFNTNYCSVKGRIWAEHKRNEWKKAVNKDLNYSMGYGAKSLMAFLGEDEFCQGI